MGGFLKEFEQRLEYAVSRLFPRRRGERVQPLEIARSMARAMERQRTLGVESVYVPNRFHVRVHPDDLALLEPVIGTVRRDAVEHLAKVALKRGFAFAGSVDMSLVADASLASGEVAVDASFREDEREVRDPVRMEQTLARSMSVVAGTSPGARLLTEVQERVGGTQTYRFQLNGSASGKGYGVEVVEGPDRGRTVSLPKERAFTIGRGNHCDLVLSDPRVSKTHAVVRYEEGDWVIEDLESTNGTHRDGQPITRSVWRVDAHVTVGLTTLRLLRKEGDAV